MTAYVYKLFCGFTHLFCHSATLLILCEHHTDRSSFGGDTCPFHYWEKDTLFLLMMATLRKAFNYIRSV